MAKTTETLGERITRLEAERTRACEQLAEWNAVETELDANDIAGSAERLRHRASEIEILREVVRLLRLDIAEAKEAKRKAEAAARAERAEALQPAYNASIETAFNAAFDLVAAIAAYRESEREILRLGGETANAVFTSDFIKRLRGELQRWSCIGAGYDRRLSFKLNERLPLNDLLPR